MTNKGRGSKGPGPIEARARGFCPPCPPPLSLGLKLLPGSAETTPKKMAPNSHVTDARTAESNEAHRSNSQVPEDVCSESEGSD